MNVYVTYAVKGRYMAEVKVPEGTSPEDIIKMANDIYVSADFGELDTVDAEAIYIEDESDRRIWEQN